jgi:hypothetical protein
MAFPPWNKEFRRGEQDRDTPVVPLYLAVDIKYSGAGGTADIYEVPSKKAP